MPVEIYKTNVQEATEAFSIRKMLLEHFPDYKINFDLSDCDKILRIKASFIHIEKIIALINRSGYKCELISE